MNKKMSKSVTKNYLYNMIYQILISIVPLITTPYLSRTLGAEAIGIYSYTLSIVTYFILFGSLGIAIYAQREIAYAQNDKETRSKVFFEILILRFITMAISIIVFYFTCIKNTEYGMYYKIFLIQMIANCLDISWFFQGLEEFKKTVMRNTIVKIISVILILLLIKKPEDLLLYILIYCLSTLIGNLSLWIYLPKYICKQKLKNLEFKKHLRPLLELFIPQIAVQVYTVLDKTMIGAIVNDKSEVGYYEQAEKIVKLLLTVITSLGTVMLPRISYEFANKNKEKIKETMEKSINFVLILSFPMIMGLIVISPNFIPLFLGDGFEPSITIMQLLTPIILFIGMGGIIGTQLLLPTKRQKQYTIAVVLGAIINVILNLMLIGKIGAKGATIGTVAAEFVSMSVQIYFIRKDIDINIMLKKAIKYFVLSVVMLIVCMSIYILEINRLATVVLQVLIGVSVYFGLLVITKDDFTRALISKVKKILIK